MDTSMMISPNYATLATANAQSKTQTDYGTAMLAKSLDTYQQNGAALTKMMELSVNPSVGSNFDMSV